MKTINKDVQSLEKELAAAKSSENDERAIDILESLLKVHSQTGNYSEFLERALELQTYFHRSDNKRKEAYILISIGDVSNVIGYNEKAVEYCQNSLEILEDLDAPYLSARAYTILGNTYDYMGNLENALKNLLSAVTIYEENISDLNQPGKEPDKAKFADAIVGVGILWGKLNRVEKSRDYFHRALDIYKELGHAHGITKTLNNLGVSYSEENPQKTLGYYQKALDIAQENGLKGISVAYTNNIGGVYEDIEDYENALKYYYKALDLVDSIGIPKYKGFILKHIGTVHLKRKSYDIALQSLDKSLHFFMQNNQQEEIEEVFNLFSQIYEQIEDYKSALEYHKKYAQLKDEIFNAEKSRQIAEMQTKYETEKKKKEAEIYRLKNVELVEKNELISQQKEEIETQNQHLLETLNELQRTQKQLIESEKMAALGSLVTGVAHEINTPVGVGITACSHIVNKTDQFEKKFEKDEVTYENLRDYMDTMREAGVLSLKNLQRTAELVESFKQVSVDQINEKRRQFNVRAYIDDVLFSLSPNYKNRDITIELVCDETLEIESYPGIFAQIITNFVTNSLMYGFDQDKSGKINIYVEKEMASLKFEYRDNGNGIPEKILPKVFDPFVTSNPQTGKGLGLHIVYNLVTQKLNGSISCESKDGVWFKIEIPF